MPYGIETRDNIGNLTFDSNTLSSRLRYTTIALAGNSGNIDLPDIEGRTVAHFSVLADEGSDKMSHYTSKNGTTISWSPRSSDFDPSGDSLIMIFILN